MNLLTEPVTENDSQYYIALLNCFLHTANIQFVLNAERVLIQGNFRLIFECDE
jgi:hypothetical protein